MISIHCVRAACSRRAIANPTNRPVNVIPINCPTQSKPDGTKSNTNPPRNPPTAPPPTHNPVRFSDLEAIPTVSPAAIPTKSQANPRGRCVLARTQAKTASSESPLANRS